MLDATNIEQKSHTKHRPRRVYETLTTAEKKRLRAITIGHGNLAACLDAIGKPNDRGMVMRAIAGGRLMPENAQKIRDYINSRP